MTLKEITNQIIGYVNLIYDYRCGNIAAEQIEWIKEKMQLGNQMVLTDQKLNPNDKRLFFICSYITQIALPIIEKMIHLEEIIDSSMEKEQLLDTCAEIDEEINKLETAARGTINFSDFFDNVRSQLEHYQNIILKKDNKII